MPAGSTELSTWLDLLVDVLFHLVCQKTELLIECRSHLRGQVGTRTEIAVNARASAGAARAVLCMVARAVMRHGVSLAMLRASRTFDAPRGRFKSGHYPGVAAHGSVWCR